MIDLEQTTKLKDDAWRQQFCAELYSKFKNTFSFMRKREDSKKISVLTIDGIIPVKMNIELMIKKMFF